jgi:membrane-associated protease RseP (regulator of RpoE activity)
MSQAPPDTGEQPDHPEPGPSKPPPPPPPPPVDAAEERRSGLFTLAALAVLVGFVWVRWGWGVVLMIGIILVILTLHELGHFVAAKWAGMKVTEFFLGFGPRLWSFRRGETDYGLKPLLVGAYVRIIGMNNLDEVPPGDEPRTYRQQSFPKRLLAVLAGPATHFVQAWLFLFLLFAVVGVPGNSALSDEEPVSWSVGAVEDDSAAAAAELEQGDRIVAWNGERVGSWPELQRAINRAEVDDEVTLTVERDGRRFETTTTIGRRPEDLSDGDDPAGSPFLGVGPTFRYGEQRYGVVESLGRAGDKTVWIAKESVLGIGRFLTPGSLGDFADTVRQGADDAPEGTSGGGGSQGETNENRPVSILGVLQIGAEVAEEGVAPLLELLIVINIFLGILNLVPLPPFDGGHAALAVYERLRSSGGRRYHADMTKLLPLVYVVVFGVLMLGVLTIYLDAINPVTR